MSQAPTLRVARPTDDLDALVPFYRDGLGFDILYRFENHDGFDGLMFGHPGAPYHFEFTHARGHAVGRSPTQDHLVVFYLHDRTIWSAAVARMRGSGFEPIVSFNPYWDRQGMTFEDPDGYRVVLQNASWST
jgi:catechol 2,3-dioxygenase-like lactoylglutathione lyase family enzyme